MTTAPDKATAARLADDPRKTWDLNDRNGLSIMHHRHWRDEVCKFLRTLAAQPDDLSSGPPAEASAKAGATAKGDAAAGDEVEIVARAICKANGHDPDDTKGVSGLSRPPMWTVYCDDARAAIAALAAARKP